MVRFFVEDRDTYRFQIKFQVLCKFEENQRYVQTNTFWLLLRKTVPKMFTIFLQLLLGYGQKSDPMAFESNYLRRLVARRSYQLICDVYLLVCCEWHVFLAQHKVEFVLSIKCFIRIYLLRWVIRKCSCNTNLHESFTVRSNFWHQFHVQRHRERHLILRVEY